MRLKTIILPIKAFFRRKPAAKPRFYQEHFVFKAVGPQADCFKWMFRVYDKQTSKLVDSREGFCALEADAKRIAHREALLALKKVEATCP